ncbi:MAG: ABC transporter ATP-binding protein [Gaiellaceae bacterium]
MREVARGARTLLGLAWRYSKPKTTLAVGLMLANYAAAPLVALSLRDLTNSAYVDHNALRAAVFGAVTAGLVIAALTLGHFAHISYFELADTNMLELDSDLILLANGSPGIEHQERADYTDRLTIIREEMFQLQASLEALLTAFGLAVAMIETGVLLAMVNPILLLLPLLSLPPLLTGRWAQNRLDRARDESAGEIRLSRHLFRQATSAGPAKELRLFGLQNELRRRHAELWDGATRRLWRVHRSNTIIRALGQLVFAVGYVASVLLVVRGVITNHGTPGDVVLAITLAAQVNAQVSIGLGLVYNLQGMAKIIGRYHWLKELVAGEQQVAPDRPTPSRIRRGISFEDLTFKYPGTDRVVLGGVNLELPAGSTVAIVGENGAGKTTLVKLLCRFYEPQSGHVLLDGADIRRFEIGEWRERIASGFQDFARFELIARQTVGVGDLPQLDSEPAVEGALERAHASDVIGRLEQGLSTQLGKSYAEGTELSGGQWQKLALGRAMMRETPLLLVLDEPTSALDAQAEHELFERYAENAKRVGTATGAITLFVSHRFSTVRMADLIVVVADGKVLESGSHSELMQLNGLYAELYELQAKAYR